MANRLNVSNSAMQEIKAKIDDSASDINSVLTRCDEIMSRLQAGWKGAAFDSYYKQYQQISDSLDATVKYMNKFSEAVSEALRIFAETDADIAGSFISN